MNASNPQNAAPETVTEQAPQPAHMHPLEVVNERLAALENAKPVDNTKLLADIRAFLIPWGFPSA